MEINNEAFEELLDIMNLGMTLRQDQLNGHDLRSGREVLKEYLENKLDKSNLIIVGVGQDLERVKALAIIKEKGLENVALVVGDIAEQIAKNDVKPKIEDLKLTLQCHSYDDFHTIDINDSAKSGTNPSGRKRGNSKKRRKH